MPKCPSCNGETIVVMRQMPFIVTRIGTHGWHGAESFGKFDHTPVHEDDYAFCNSFKCIWQGTLKNALSVT